MWQVPHAMVLSTDTCSSQNSDLPSCATMSRWAMSAGLAVLRTNGLPSGAAGCGQLDTSGGSPWMPACSVRWAVAVAPSARHETSAGTNLKRGCMVLLLVGSRPASR